MDLVDYVHFKERDYRWTHNKHLSNVYEKPVWSWVEEPSKLAPSPAIQAKLNDIFRTQNIPSLLLDADDELSSILNSVREAMEQLAEKDRTLFVRQQSVQTARCRDCGRRTNSYYHITGHCATRCDRCYEIMRSRHRQNRTDYRWYSG